MINAVNNFFSLQKFINKFMKCPVKRKEIPEIFTFAQQLKNKNGISLYYFYTTVHLNYMSCISFSSKGKVVAKGAKKYFPIN
jgi:hypothetical protein